MHVQYIFVIHESESCAKYLFEQRGEKVHTA